MTKRKYIMLAAALTISTAFLLNGCGEKTQNNQDLSAEEEIFIDDEVQVQSRWYSGENSKLASATVAVYVDDEVVFQESTDDNGNLAPFTVPSNTELKYVVTDAAGTVIAESEFIYKISTEYTDLSIAPASEEDDIQEIYVPVDKTSLTAAIFITEGNTISHANLTSYSSTTTSEAQPSDENQSVEGEISEEEPVSEE